MPSSNLHRPEIHEYICQTLICTKINKISEKRKQDRAKQIHKRELAITPAGYRELEVVRM